MYLGERQENNSSSVKEIIKSFTSQDNICTVFRICKKINCAFTQKQLSITK